MNDLSFIFDIQELFYAFLKIFPLLHFHDLFLEILIVFKRYFDTKIPPLPATAPLVFLYFDAGEDTGRGRSPPAL